MNNPVTQIGLSSVINYFNTLQKTGNVSDSLTEKILILTFIDELLQGELVPILSREEYKIIDNFVHLFLGKSVLIPYTDYYSFDKVINTRNNVSFYRISEDNLLRILEDTLFLIA